MQDESKTKAQLIEELEQTRKRVAELEQAEETLRESEEKYRTIYENVTDQIVYFNKYGTIISVNDHEETYGRKPEEIIGKNFTKLGYFDVKDIPKYLKLFKDVITGNEVLDVMKLEVKHTDGHRIPVEVSTSLIKKNGKIDGFLCIARDITERKQSEEALREREERYRTVVEDMPALICRFRPDGTLSFVNSAYCEYFGKTYKELIGHNFFNFIPVKDREKVQDHYNSINKKRPVITYEHQVIAPDGTIRWQRWTDRGLYDASGTLVEYQSIGEDITERKEAEEKLRESEERFRLMFENTGTDNAVISVDGVLLMMNEMGAGHLGGKPKDFVGKSIHDFFSKDTCDKYQRRFHDVIESWKGKVYEDFVELPTGNRWFLTNIQPVKEPDGGLICVQLVSQDITERKQADAKLEATQEQLRNLSRYLQSIREEDRTILAREIHDELGQALTALKFGLVELKNALPADQISLVEKATSMAEYIDTTAQTVNRIATQLRPTLLDELGLVEAIEWEVEEFEDRTGIKCELTVEPEEMEVDRDRSTAIYRIVQEALTNIARHTQATRSAVSLKMADGRLHLSITDNGIGIAEDKILNPRSLGIIGMRERVLSVGGNFIINRIKKRGTKIMVIIPVENES